MKKTLHEMSPAEIIEHLLVLSDANNHHIYDEQMLTICDHPRWNEFSSSLRKWAWWAMARAIDRQFMRMSESFKPDDNFISF